MAFRVITFGRGGAADPCWQATPLGDCATRDEAQSAGERWLASVRGEAGDGAVAIVDRDKSSGGIEWIGSGWLPPDIGEMIEHAADRARGQVESRGISGLRDCGIAAPKSRNPEIPSLRDGLLRIRDQLLLAARAIDTALAAGSGEKGGWVEEEP
jgi:hypothetical protein